MWVRNLRDERHVVDAVCWFPRDPDADGSSRVEAERFVIGPRANQEDTRPADGTRRLEAPAEQRPADPLAAQRRQHGERAEKQRPGTPVPDGNRRLLNATD